MMRRSRRIVLFRALCSSYWLSILAHAGPVKVFILAGQSNMVGMGSIDHLDLLVQNCTTSVSGTSNYTNKYQRALCRNGTYIVRDDVFIKFDNHHGNLTVGKDSGNAGRRSFGPELMIGVELGNQLATKADPILLVKTAWGGKSLAVDFRPPASGEANFSGIRPIQYGVYYRAMILEILDTLSHLDVYIPGYSKNGQGYELSGFVWFQGWNDMLQWEFVNEYEANLANLMRDVRRDLDTPSLPVVIGELGMHGPHPQGKGAGRVLKLRAAELNVTKLPEFRNNSLFVQTNQYVVANGTQYTGGYHYYGRADTYFHIGKALGQGMLAMIGSAVWAGDATMATM